MSVERKRVLFVVPSFAGGGGGAERVLAVLLRHLDNERFEIHVAAIQGTLPFSHDLPPHVMVYDLGVSRMRHALPAVVRVARRVRPHIIFSTVVFANATVLLARSFLPKNVRFIIREATTPSAFIAHSARLPHLWKWIYGRLYRKADKIVCLSDAMVADLTAFGLARDRLTRIHNPVDTDAIQAAGVNAQNPYLGAGPNLVAAGRLAFEKGFDVLLAAMPAVAKEFPGVHLTILGEGPLLHDLQRRARALGIEEKVSLPGFQPEPWSYLRHADAFVLSSRFEGLPNVVLEALALGTPVIATDCPGGIREIKEALGEIFLVPPENPAALAQEIISLCKSKRRVDVTAGLRSVFGVSKAMAAYVELLG